MPSACLPASIFQLYANLLLWWLGHTVWHILFTSASTWCFSCVGTVPYTDIWPLPYRMQAEPHNWETQFRSVGYIIFLNGLMWTGVMSCCKCLSVWISLLSSASRRGVYLTFLGTCRMCARLCNLQSGQEPDKWHHSSGNIHLQDSLYIHAGSDQHAERSFSKAFWLSMTMSYTFKFSGFVQCWLNKTNKTHAGTEGCTRLHSGIV